jgi:hypothetical protein
LVSAGDLNNDGLMDLVVGNLGLIPEFKPDRNVIYINEGRGLSQEPEWISPSVNAFSCALGDPDGDGDLDIAFAQGIAPPADSQPIAVYTNHNGLFNPTPDWESDRKYFGVDVAFVDIDMDGDHDLAAGGKFMGLVVFYNHEGNLETKPSWGTDKIVGGRQMAFGDVDGDGDPDCAVAGINESFFIFLNNSGILEEEPSWSFGDFKEPSCVAFGDADNDGDLDLAIGGWFYPAGVFENIDGAFPDTFAWSDTVPGFGQSVVWADFDGDGLKKTREEFKGDGVRKLFYLKHRPLHLLHEVKLNGQILKFKEYCYDPLEAWISLKNAPESGGKLEVEYTYSVDLDLTVTSRVASIFENLLRE